MTKVLSGDLSSMNSSAVITLLKDTAEDSNKVLNRISTFINNSKTVCKGGGYDAVRAKMSLYLDALRKQSKICVNLSNNVVCANNSMLNYMEGYTELDNAKLPEINNSINEADRTISWLREIVYDYEYDNKGQIISVNSHTRGDQSLINSWVGVLTELKKIREKLENLESADSSAYSSIADAEVDTINFINATNGISNNSFSKSNLETNKDVADVSELQAQQISAADPLIATPLAATRSNVGGNYTYDEITNTSEETVKNMSKEEFMDFVGTTAQMVYKDRGGGVLPSITIAQAMLESGFGKSFSETTHNLYGLMGYPSDRPVVYGLRQFDNFYDSTYAHADYFDNYPDVYGNFNKDCENHDALSAAARLSAYANGSSTYADSIISLINEYDLTRYDNV